MAASILRLIISLILCFAAASVGGLFTQTGKGTWYRTLQQPEWAPPDWVFGPVWSTLYLLMAVSLWLVWKRAKWSKGKAAIVLFLVQLVLNAAWSAVFFAAHAPGWAFVEISALWLAIVATIAAFWSISQAAAWLMIPYLAWVSFALVLNFEIWRLN